MADTRYDAALSNAHAILDVERFLHLDFELGANQWLAKQDLLNQVASEVYQHTHTGFTMFILLWCYVSGSHIYRPARNSLILINVVGLAVFFVLPVAPPRLLPGAGYIDTVAGAGYGISHSSPVSMSPAQYAAMPSLHMAWALWVFIVAFVLLRRFRRLRWLTTIHPISTAIAVVITGNHYTLDVVAGAVLAWATFLAVGLFWAAEGTPYFGRQLIRRPPRPAPATDGPTVEIPEPAVPPGPVVPRGAPSRAFGPPQESLEVRTEETAG